MSCSPLEAESLVRAFLAQELGLPADHIVATDDLRTKYGVDGEDADELLQKFAEQFEVDIKSIDLDDYFGPEIGFSPFRFLLRLVWADSSSPDYKPLTVRMLIDAATKGYFSSRKAVPDLPSS